LVAAPWVAIDPDTVKAVLFNKIVKAFEAHCKQKRKEGAGRRAAATRAPAQQKSQ
jgi:hypothetical protein